MKNYMIKTIFVSPKDPKASDIPAHILNLFKDLWAENPGFIVKIALIWKEITAK